MSEHQANVKASCAEKNMNKTVSGVNHKKMSMTKSAIKRKNAAYKQRMEELRNGIKQDKKVLEDISVFKRIVNSIFGERNAKSNTELA